MYLSILLPFHLYLVTIYLSSCFSYTSPTPPSYPPTPAGIYSLVGRCFDMRENRARAIRALRTALYIDPACTEVADYLLKRGLLSTHERCNTLRMVLMDLIPGSGREWLQPWYRWVWGVFFGWCVCVSLCVCVSICLHIVISPCLMCPSVCLP